MLVEIIIFLITFRIFYFFYVHWKLCERLDKNGLKYLKAYPLLGNNMKSTLSKSHIVDDYKTVYSAFPEEKYVAFIEGSSSAILLRDPEIIKNVTVKDFDSFVNHKDIFPEVVDPLFTKSVFAMKDSKWRDMRSTLSPAFTASKMRLMIPFMKEISSNIVQYLQDHQGEDIDVDDVARRYSNDVIASAGFGINVNSLRDRDSEFYKMGRNIFKFSGWQKLSMMIVFRFPFLVKMFGSKLFPQTTSNFFRNIVLTTMEYREKNNVERPDMIHLLMQAKKGTLKANQNEKDDAAGFAVVDDGLKQQKVQREWTSDEIVAQVYIFFIAGFETTASTAVMTIHELALNPDEQEKLYTEVKTFYDAKGDVTYESLSELKYLDCVLNETMRKWPASVISNRVCLKPYELPPPREGGKPYKLKPGDVIYSSVHSIHSDPKHYPKPEIWNPDRFSEENRHNIQPFTFMPFGSGPRSCIGSRFAILEVKTLLFYLVLNFKIVKCSKTMDPIKLRPQGFNIVAADGSWVRFEARK